jgi:hypothetical protein
MKSRTDTCCDCACYPNGVIAVLLAQLLLLGGFILSTGVMLGCDFVIADINSTDMSEYYYNNGTNTTTFLFGNESEATTATTRRGFGFFNHQDANGLCHFEQMGNQFVLNEINATDAVIDYTVDYLDWLGPDWEMPRDLAIAAVSTSFLLWMWLLLLTCVSHPRTLRYILSGLIILVVMSLQFGTFAILGSEFCQERNCEIGRLSKFSIGAGMMFFVSGILLSSATKNYPGILQANNKTTPRDEETHHVEEATAVEELQGGPYSYQPSRETIEASKPQLY